MNDRVFDGPAPGTYVIAIELPPEADREQVYSLEVAVNNIAKHFIPGAYTTGHRVMPDKGKHGFTEGSNPG